ncbi:1,2-dihydroxy-3-keto-5-methylthiopentene dioxygenase [Marasmius tenuissimus]|uniref:1,2-dihydroxy-3-keto-5-methylthiopentene dioxygenase n=1 Tax=Marasmius tenuissimus TaxID=585030 RepID=A0ABR2ZIW2_9AGAR
MSLRAYYRNPTAGDLSLPLDSGRPVSEEKLRALGCKWWSVEGSLDQRMKTFRELSKTLGFKDGDTEHFFDLSKETAGSPHDLAMAPKAVLESWGKDLLIPDPIIVLYVASNMYIDLKEPGTDSFIRLVVPPKYAIFYPGGTVFQASSHDDDLLGLQVHVLYKGTDPANVFVFGEEVDKHPARVDYVQRVCSDAEA